MKSDFLTNLFFRALQTVSIATMLVRLLLPVAIVAALYLLWRIARNLEKPPKLTEEAQDRAQVAFRDAQGESHPLQDDAGVCG
ncbi:MAG: hypothetical protein ACLVJH_05325 [Faecalibacterium prausnitzii]